MGRRQRITEGKRAGETAGNHRTIQAMIQGEASRSVGEAVEHIYSSWRSVRNPKSWAVYWCLGRDLIPPPSFSVVLELMLLVLDPCMEVRCEKREKWLISCCLIVEANSVVNYAMYSLWLSKYDPFLLSKLLLSWAVPNKWLVDGHWRWQGSTPNLNIWGRSLSAINGLKTHGR